MVNELILPNFTQSGAAFAVDGTVEKYFGRSAFTRCVVPVDDERCVAYAWGIFGERALRRLCRDLAGGKPPPQPTDLARNIIPTYGNDTVIKAPQPDGNGGRALLNRINDRVMDFFSGRRSPRRRAGPVCV